MFDVFFSYRRLDLAHAQPMIDAMARAGLRIWRDEDSIPDGVAITREIREGIAASKLLVAFYSSSYPMSRACQQELALAYVAAQHIDELAHRRVVIINPEVSFEHIPLPLRDHQAIPWREDGSTPEEIAIRVRDIAASLDTPLAAAVQPLPDFHGFRPIEANRFIGRHSLFWALHGHLTASRMSILSNVQGQSLVALRGLGGIGKTLLAREYAIRFGRAFPGGIYWINAYGHEFETQGSTTFSRESLLIEQIRDFAIGAGVMVEGATPAQLRFRFWSELKRRGAPCLWIVDDLSPGATKDELENIWCAQWPGAATLITSRTREHDSVGACIDVGPLESPESVMLLGRHRRPDSPTEESAARRIAETLGHHPLALDVAGNYLGKGIQTFTAYLEDLAKPDEDALEIASQLRAALPTGHERSISRTLQKSFDLLNETGLEFFKMASLLAPASIPLILLQDAFALAPNASGDRRKAFQDAVDQGDELGLCDQRSSDARNVHRLISRVFQFRESRNPEHRSRRNTLMRALLGRLISLADVCEHPKMSREIVHARYLLSQDIDGKDEAQMALWIARYDSDRGEYQAARSLQERVLAAYRRLAGELAPETITAMNNLGITLSDQGELAEARTLLETAARLRLQVQGPNHPDTPMALNNLAGVLFEQGNLRGARDLQEKARADLHRLLGDSHENTQRVTLNLSVTLHAQGELLTARRLQENLLYALRQKVGITHPRTLEVAGDLAMTLASQGQLGGARKLQEEVLQETRGHWGNDHPRTLHQMFDLAVTALEQGDLRQARTLNEQLLEVNRRLLGEEHNDTLKTMNNLASTMQQQGEWADARRLLEKIIDVRAQKDGAEHPDTMTTRNNLANVLLECGEYARARELQAAVLNSLVVRLGPEHPNTLTTKGNLAYALHKEGNTAAALLIQEEVLSDTCRVLGDSHPDAFRAVNNLALMLKTLGKHAEARLLEETLWSHSRVSLGAEHPGTLAVQNNLADTLRHLGELHSAISLYEQVLIARTGLLGSEHPDTLTTKNNLATALHSRGNVQRAAVLAEEVVAASRRVIGATHPNTLQMIENLATMRLQLGDHAGSRTLCEEAAEIRKRNSVIGD